MMNYANNEASVQEQLSALVDGELNMEQTSAVVLASRADANLMQTWASYQAIGQVLRGHASDAARLPVKAAAQTPVTNAAPARSALEAAHIGTASVQPVPLVRSAANDSVFRWKLVAGVAAFAAIGSMVWALVGTQVSPTGVQLAQRAAPVPVVAAASTVPTSTPTATSAPELAPVMLRDPRLDELLAAHKQFGGASALQQPAGFLRNATFQSSGR